MCMALNGKDITKIKERLLSGYDKDVIPTDNNQPLNATVSVNINDMVPLEKASMHFSIDCHFGLRWRDPRLKYNATKNVTYIPFDHNFFTQIWTPDIYFTKSKAGFRHALPQPNVMVSLLPDGTVLSEQRVSVSSFCPMEMRFYPFDIQECTANVESYSYNRDYLRLYWRKERNADSTNGDELYITEFNQVEISLSETSVDYSQYGVYSRLALTVKLYRNLALYILRDFFPCILIVMLSWVGFWINYGSTPARVALGITTVLTVVTLTNNVRSNSPEASSFRSLDYYMLFCNLFVFAALVEYALVGMTDPKSRKKQKLTKENLPNGSVNGSHAKVEAYMNEAYIGNNKVNANSNGVVHKRASPKDPAELLREQRGPVKKEAHIIDKVARVLFPVFFAILNIVYFTFHRLHPDTVD